MEIQIIHRWTDESGHDRCLLKLPTGQTRIALLDALPEIREELARQQRVDESLSVPQRSPSASLASESVQDSPQREKTLPASAGASPSVASTAQTTAQRPAASPSASSASSARTTSAPLEPSHGNAPSTIAASGEGHLTTPDQQRAFVLAGKAEFRLVGAAYGDGGSTASHVFTVQLPRRRQHGTRPHFVSVKDSSEQYGKAYLGTLFRNRDGSYTFRHTAKARRPANSVEFRLVSDFLNCVLNGKDPRELGIACYHVSKCGKCGRKLDTPESIARGLGPVCAGVA